MSGSFNINNFRSQLQYDGARPNYFQVMLTFPTGVVNAATAGQKAQFMCKAAQLPSRTIGMAPLFYFGREVKLPGNATYADWTITIINDEDFLIRNAFESWSNMINYNVGNYRDPTMVNSLGYSVPATIIQYGKAQNAIKQYDFTGMWPMDPSPIDVDWSSNDTVEEFTVTMCYQYWTSTAIAPATTDS
jgi:T4-like virus tail tube protein gp19